MAWDACPKETKQELELLNDYDVLIKFEKGIKQKNTEIYFNKPIFVCQAILDISETSMFDFHYNYVEKKYRKKAELWFTDTDSLMYEIETEDFYNDIKEDIKKSLIGVILQKLIHRE